MSELIGVLVLVGIAFWIVSKAKKSAGKFEQREIQKQKCIEQAKAKAEKERQRKLDEEIRKLDENISYYEHGDVEDDEEDDM